MDGDAVLESRRCINDAFTDDVLSLILGRVESQMDKAAFGLVCKRWLHLQSTETEKINARAGLHMLRRMVHRFTRLLELDYSQFTDRQPIPYSGNGITDADLAVIANGFPCLRVLNLHMCREITDVGMKAIGEGLPLLQSLDLSFFLGELTDEGLSAVAKGCCDLRILLSGHVTDGVLEALSNNCPNLEELQCGADVTDDGLIKLASGCRKIRVLDLKQCYNVTDVGVSSISRGCSASLKTLNLSYSHKIGDGTILTLAKFCGNLETLGISACYNVSSDAIKSLATSCGSSLKGLGIDWCGNISDSSVSCILSQCRNLEALDISGCTLTDAAFQFVSTEERGLSLKRLGVAQCPNITVAGIGIIVSKCPFLEHLNVTSCPHITKSGLDEADFHFPECCMINFHNKTRLVEFI